MRLLVDTNILLYAANEDGPEHRLARRFLDEQIRARSPWCVTWPILYEFLRVSTHPRVFRKPLSAEKALAFLSNLLALEELVVLPATERHFEVLRDIVKGLGHPAGNLFHDIHTAALMREHGVPEIVTADTDFLQFRFLRVSNPCARS